MLSLAWKIDWLLSKVIQTNRKISKHSAQSLLNQDEISNEKVKNYLNYEFEKIDPYLDKIVIYFNK
jgi:dihydroflavonol-4-reductase